MRAFALQSPVGLPITAQASPAELLQPDQTKKEYKRARTALEQHYVGRSAAAAAVVLLALACLPTGLGSLGYRRARGREGGGHIFHLKLGIN